MNAENARHLAEGVFFVQRRIPTLCDTPPVQQALCMRRSDRFRIRFLLLYPY